MDKLTLEDKIRELICWEDPDSFITIAVTEDGNISLTDSEWRRVYTAPTFAEALEKKLNAEKDLYEG